MSNEELARLLAERSRIPNVTAADQVDQVVHKILKKLRHGQSTRLPGLGCFKPGSPTRFEFKKGPSGKGGGRGRQ